MTSLHIIILAAGKGVRMHSNKPKVLQPLAGMPLLRHILNNIKPLAPEKIHIVCGHGKDTLKAAFANEKLSWIEQKKQLGTGHAVLQALPKIPHASNILVLCGDIPLITSQTLQNLIDNTPPKAIGLLTAKVRNSDGFGRIIRTPKGNIKKIVEEKDANRHERMIKEINTGIMYAKTSLFKKYLPQLKTDNAQKEYYLTDIIAIAVKNKRPIVGIIAKNTEEVLGVNDKIQLAKLERHYQLALAEQFLRQGVTILDPNRFDLRGHLDASQDVSIDINVILEGKVRIGSNSTIGPNCYLRDVTIGSNVHIKANSVIEGATIEDGAVIGPFARIRPESHIKENAHVGNFVEVKKTTIGQNSKANHLTYLGDTIVGDNVNIGAGTITCNYDGANKHQTIIEDGAFIGSGVELVAPVTIGANATIGAGSTITENTPAEKLTLSRPKQTTVEKWLRPKKKL